MKFCEATEDLVFFGGGAGGGKTYAALCDNLQGVHDPEYVSVFFRTNTTEISKGLWIEAKKLYKNFLKDEDGNFLGEAHIDEQGKCITWPSGAKTYFSYLELDKHADSWYGLEIAKAYFEEAQFRSWYQFNTILSRNRSKAQVQKGFRATLNPDRQHWVYNFCKRFTDEDGYPIKEFSGRRAYYLIVKDELHTSWSKEELLEKFPEKTPLSYTYIPATFQDNKKLQEFDPTYKDKLDSLPEVKRKQLLEGCWLDTGNTGMYFKREWLQEADRLPYGVKKCRAYDLAFSEKTPTTDPDFTVGIGMAKSRDGYFYLFGDYHPDFKDSDSEITGRMRKRSGERDRIILKQAQMDTEQVPIVLPEDSGAAGKDSFLEKVKFFSQEGFIVKKDNASHTANKLTKVEPFFAASENGLVYIVKSSFSEETYQWLMSELESFDPQKGSGRLLKDDAVDACGTAYRHLAKERAAPIVRRNQQQSTTAVSSVVDRSLQNIDPEDRISLRDFDF